MTQKALISQVQFGNLFFEGLMLPNGSFAIAVPQIVSLFESDSFTQNYASQTLKRMLGEGFRPHKVKTELGNQLINTVSLEQFEYILIKLDREKGNKKAQDFRDNLTGLSLHQLFCDAFGIKFDSEERQQWLTLRFQSKVTRRSYTDILKEKLIQQYGEDTYKLLCKQGYFKDVTMKVNQHLFGQPHFKCNRDNMTTEQLVDIEHFERQLERRARRYPEHTAEQLLQWMLDNF